MRISNQSSSTPIQYHTNAPQSNSKVNDKINLVFSKDAQKPSRDKKQEDSKSLSLVQRELDHIREMQESRNPRLEKIITKFRSGKKLTEHELEYLARECPEISKKVREILQQREELEEAIRRAKSDEEVDRLCLTAMSSAAEIKEDGAMKSARVLHLNNAKKTANKRDGLDIDETTDQTFINGNAQLVEQSNSENKTQEQNRDKQDVNIAYGAESKEEKSKFEILL